MCVQARMCFENTFWLAPRVAAQGMIEEAPDPQMHETRRIEAGESKPDAFGLSLVGQVQGESAGRVLKKVRSAWSIIASWGRWSDGKEGSLQTVDDRELLVQLPDWLTEAFEESGDLEGWLDEIFDRDWIWWGSTAYGNQLKIDISSQSMPTSTWPISRVILAAGGENVRVEDWFRSEGR